MEKILEAAKHQINMLLEETNFVIVAIDGKCTSGKTTLASQLAEIYDCNVFHMDDFFLRPEQRTPERFAEVGGNVDYERFHEEVLLPLKSGKAFSYRPFDCSTFTLAAPVTVAPKKLNVIEGTYSHHPYFGNPYDLKILLTVDEETQRQRILERPAFLHKRFFEEWIPMENRYFDGFAIPSEAGFII
jgi:uridine kinase